MLKGPIGRLCSLLRVLLLTTVIVAFFPVIGAAFYARIGFSWLRDHMTPRGSGPHGFLFASIYAVITTLLAILFFQPHSLPRFNDIFLVGIVLTAYRFSWRPAAYLLAISLLVTAWVLPPSGNFFVTQLSDWYRLASFSMVSAFLITVVVKLKHGQAPEAPKGEPLRLQHLAGMGD